ncbi:MAG: restriction endonuclease subunit S [Chloroflexales bacterium]
MRDVSSSWLRGKLGDFITLQRGFDLPEYERQFGTVPVVTSAGISGTHAEAKVRGPGVVMGRYGTIGQIYYINQDYWPHNTSLYIKDFKGNHPKFFYYFLKTVNYESHNDKSSVPGLNRNHLHLVEITVPAPEEQRAIARILGALDDKIELNRRQNAILEALARAIFQSWFVDFDPVHAKAAGRAPAAMDAATAALFPAAFEVRDGREVPRGWRVKSIGDVTRVVGGSTPSTQEPAFWEGGMHHWATPKDLSSLATIPLLDTERCITDAGLSQIGSGLLPPGTVLLSSRAPIGYTVIAEISVAINQGFIAMICDRGLPNHYVLWWTRANLDEIKGRANGTTFLEISKSNFRPMLVTVPSASILDAFVEVMEPLYQKVRANLLQTRTLATLRDMLLPRLLSGELRVRAAAALVEGAL